MTRKPLASMGLTAARFDLLYAVVGADDDWRGPGIRQSELRRMLGVTAPVVTRMPQALEILGLVRREREDLGDRRQIRVSLTKAGRRRIVRARGVMVRAMRRLVHVAICFGQHRNPEMQWWHTDRLDGYLQRIRDEFGDTAWLRYPWWHPDD